MNTKEYELTCEISPLLNELELKELIEKIDVFITDLGAKTQRKSEPVKKRLPRMIKKHKEVFLVDFMIESTPDKIEQISKKIKSEPEILRHIIIAKKYSEEIARKPLRREKRLRDFIGSKKAEKPKKVELQEIDQKIEEILKE